MSNDRSRDSCKHLCFCESVNYPGESSIQRVFLAGNEENCISVGNLYFIEVTVEGE